MATKAQIKANRENAKKSHGATTPEGREASSKNHTIHGLCFHNNLFFLLEGEDENKLDHLLDQLIEEHKPETITEEIIVRNMGHHEWLRGRALRLQDGCLRTTGFFDVNQVNKEFALYLRYQAQHERGFFKCLRELQNLRNEKRKVEIGFESKKLNRIRENRAHAALEVKKQALKLREDEFEFKKVRLAVFATRKTAADTSPGVEKMAA